MTLFTPCCILYCTLWMQIPKYSPCWKDELFSLRGEYLYRLFGILLCGKFVSCLPFKMYSVIYTSTMSIWTFILWWSLTHYYIFCFVAQTFQLQQLETLLIGPCDCPSDLPPHFVFWALPFPYTTGCFRLIFYIFYPNPRSSLFSKKPWFLLMEKTNRN